MGGRGRPAAVGRASLDGRVAAEQKNSLEAQSEP